MGPSATSTTVRPEPLKGSLRRVAMIGLAGLAAAGSLGACGSGVARPSQSALAAKLKADTNFSGANPAQLNCIAGVLIKHGDAASLDQFIAGKISDGQVKGSDTSNVKTEATACASRYQGG